MKIIIRPLEKKDNPVIAELIRVIFRQMNIKQEGTVYSDPTTDNLYELFKTPNSKYFVAEENGILLGGCGIFPTLGLPEGCTELVKLYLAKESRGKGIGNELMQKSISAAKELGFKQMYLESFPEFATAVDMYEKSNFKKIDKPLGNTGHFSCNLWMVKKLSSE